jgi:phosphoglycerate dehydrogenase-like enzyme
MPDATTTPDVPDVLDVLIATPLEEELVSRVAAADPRIRVHHEPSLLPAPRYPGDHSGDPDFRRDAAGEQKWGELLAGAHVLFGVPGNTPQGLRETLPRCPRLRFIQGTAAGEGQLVRMAGVDAATLERVAITSAAGVHAVPLAEFAMLGLLALARDVRGLIRDQEARTWQATRHTQAELRGRTLLLVGLGGIGREIARLAVAFGMRVLAVKRRPEPTPDVEEVHPTGRLRELAGRADAMVVTLPLTPQTEGLVDAAVLDAMPRGAWFVNLGRGGVVDEPALVERLRSGHLGGAVLDVFATEPLPPNNPLWHLPNVLVSPHMAALSPHENERIVELFRDNLRRLLSGQPLRNRILPDRPY